MITGAIGVVLFSLAGVLPGPPVWLKVALGAWLVFMVLAVTVIWPQHFLSTAGYVGVEEAPPLGAKRPPDRRVREWGATSVWLAALPALGWLTGLGLKRRLLVRRLDIRPPAQWPNEETLLPAAVQVERIPGRDARYDPLRKRILLGADWTPQDWLGSHVMAHEAAHARQPRSRLVLGEALGLICALAGLTAGLLSLGLVGAFTFTFAWDALLRWPLEADADRKAGRWVVAWATEHGGDEAAVELWAAAIARRDMAALGIETISWGLFAAGIAAATSLVMSWIV